MNFVPSGARSHAIYQLDWNWSNPQQDLQKFQNLKTHLTVEIYPETSVVLKATALEVALTPLGGEAMDNVPRKINYPHSRGTEDSE